MRRPISSLMRWMLGLAAAVLLAALGAPLVAADSEVAMARDYSRVRAPAAPRTQEWSDADAKSAGCVSCHTASDARTMHTS